MNKDPIDVFDNWALIGRDEQWLKDMRFLSKKCLNWQ